MKFLALAAVASALTLKTETEVTSPEDIAKFFLDAGSAAGVLRQLDDNTDGKITRGELNAFLKQHGASRSDRDIADGVFRSISQGRRVVTKEDLENWEAGLRTFLKAAGCTA